MAKSICNGCKHWEFLDDGLGFRFHYCNKFNTEDLKSRKIQCGGKYYMKQDGYLFSNGTEFMVWQSRNCEKCVKAVFYDEKKDKYPKYRCAIQKHIEEAAITDGRGNKRDYEATHSVICPHILTKRERQRKVKKDKNQLMLDL